MESAAAVLADSQYRAFVSYSHDDSAFAHWLHRKLEDAKAPDGSRLAPIFIDRAELAAGPDLSAQVQQALASSAALIVIASPAARASRWVAQEIELFRERHPDRPVLAALIAGEPDQAFPEALLTHQGRTVEPLAADFREGHDGKRLGLLKIVAGLTAQPLDRLVQRDAQARQRRVMAVTAATALLSLVLAALLVVAVRARSEAERQRAEAEGMVEFMLTDLRDKLKGTGSPTIMATVNQRALDYYARMDLTGLPDDSLERRARVLHAMGEDDERLGNFPDAVEKYREARRITEAVLLRNPNDPDAIFAHAQSEYWVGEAAWRQRDLPTTTLHWQGYAAQAEALARVEPGSKRSLMEQAYASGNLCELTQERDRDPVKALDFCTRSSGKMRQAHAKYPGDSSVTLALANRLGWEADVQIKAGRPDAAIELRREEAAILDALVKREPENRSFRERRIWPDIGTGEALVAQGQVKRGVAMYERCMATYELIATERPDDTSITEQQIRVAWLAALATGSRDWIDKTHALHAKLRRSHTPKQMARFDKMLVSLEKGENR
jgi:tetratricopeptide (TPR) repeat protein